MREVAVWTPSGDSFAVYDIERFRAMLPRFYKTDNYASFVRQLNMYNFRKVKNETEVPEFCHPLFKKGAENDLTKIERKTIRSSKICKLKDTKNLVSMTMLNKVIRRLDRAERQLSELERQNKELTDTMDKLSQDKDGNRQQCSNELADLNSMMTDVLNKLKRVSDGQDCNVSESGTMTVYKIGTFADLILSHFNPKQLNKRKSSHHEELTLSPDSRVAPVRCVMASSSLPDLPHGSNYKTSGPETINGKIGHSQIRLPDDAQLQTNLCLDREQTSMYQSNEPRETNYDMLINGFEFEYDGMGENADFIAFDLNTHITD